MWGILSTMFCEPLSCSRCVGEHARRTWGLLNRPQPWILWAYSQLLETRPAHHQWRHKYTRWAFWRTRINLRRVIKFNSFIECLPGVLEEARFFGIEQLAEQLEVAIKVIWSLEGKSLTFGGAIPPSNASRLTTICFLSKQNTQPPEDHSPISRKEFVRFLLATPTKSELRCQVQPNEHVFIHPLISPYQLHFWLHRSHCF